MRSSSLCVSVNFEGNWGQIYHGESGQPFSKWGPITLDR